MRNGIELKLYNKFNELLLIHSKASYAVAHLDYMVFVLHKNEFDRLTENEKMEVRTYLKAIELLHGRE